MVDASCVTQRLGLALALLIASGCTDGPPRTRPSLLAEPVTSCAKAKPDRALHLPVWDLYVVDAAWEALHADVQANVEVDAQLCLDGKLEWVELELQGVSGRTRDKKSFKIKFTEDHELAQVGFEADAHESIDKVYLKAFWIDQSMIREALAFDMWREMGHQAPRHAFANLRINGNYWGLYSVVEPVDSDYLRRNGYPEGGHLYKGTRKHGGYADFAPGRNLDLAFEDKSSDGEASRADLEQLAKTLQRTPLDQASFERQIDPIFPLDDYMDRMVWVSLTRNGDAVAQNFYLYNAPRDEHAFWQMIPWDSDLCMGSNWRGADEAVPANLALYLDGGNFFGRRLTMVPGVRERYFERFRHVIDEVLTQPVMLEHLERRAARVRHDLAEEQARWQRNVSADEAFDVIREFLAERPVLLRQGLDELEVQPPDEPAPGDATDHTDFESQ